LKRIESTSQFCLQLSIQAPVKINDDTWTSADTSDAGREGIESA
jgi:hypothetical protein